MLNLLPLCVLDKSVHAASKLPTSGYGRDLRPLLASTVVAFSMFISANSWIWCFLCLELVRDIQYK